MDESRLRRNDGRRVARARSDRHRRLLIAHFDGIDLDYVRASVREFAELIEDPERPAELEKPIARVERIPR